MPGDADGSRPACEPSRPACEPSRQLGRASLLPQRQSPGEGNTGARLGNRVRSWVIHPGL